MVAEIITIGDELLIGQVENSNASWIAAELDASGISVRRIITVSDNVDDINGELKNALSESDVVILSGGLGPTSDDRTKEALCRFFNSRLVLHQPTLDNIRSLFGSRGSTLLQVNHDQALIPENSTPLINEHGSAPGLWFESGTRIVVSLPGVPYEMKSLVGKSVIPKLRELQNGVQYFHRTIMTHGVGESLLADKIHRWEENLPGNIKLAYLPQPGIVRLRISGSGNNKDEIAGNINSEIQKVSQLIPDLIYGFDDETLEGVTGSLLRESNNTISTAESCTGGYLSHLITSVPGSSEYYQGSVVAYDNSIKEIVLGVQKESLVKYGAVSEMVVKEMAEGIKRLLRTDYALATSGVAGPGGGTEEKPVGLVYIGLAFPGGVHVKSFNFGFHRGRNIRRASLSALNLLRLKMLGKI